MVCFALDRCLEHGFSNDVSRETSARTNRNPHPYHAQHVMLCIIRWVPWAIAGETANENRLLLCEGLVLRHTYMRFVHRLKWQEYVSIDRRQHKLLGIEYCTVFVFHVKRKVMFLNFYTPECLAPKSVPASVHRLLWFSND